MLLFAEFFGNPAPLVARRRIEERTTVVGTSRIRREIIKPGLNIDWVYDVTFADPVWAIRVAVIPIGVQISVVFLDSNMALSRLDLVCMGERDALASRLLGFTHDAIGVRFR